MKKLSLFAVILIFCILSALSQSCLPGNNNFTLQSQIDNFQASNPGCTEIEGDIDIFNDDITNLNGFSVLTSIAGSLSIKWATSLVDLSGLENITSIGGDLYIGVLPSWKPSGNDSLINLDGLSGLKSIGGNLYIGFNASLTSIEGLSNLTSIGGSLEIEGNASMPNLNGLENLTSIPGNLEIGDFGGWKTPICYGNPLLLNLDGLRGINSVGGYLSIECNDMLMSLEGLENLMSISGYLNIGTIDVSPWGTLIAGNPNLTTLSGIDNIASNSIDSLNIIGNYSLTNCEVQSICDYLISLGGIANIHDNSPGCNSPEEVQDSCIANAVLIDEQYIKDKLELYPNPASQELNISAQGHTIDDVSIYTLTGQKVLQQRPVNGPVYISDLQPCMYIVEVTIENIKLRQKLLVQR